MQNSNAILETIIIYTTILILVMTVITVGIMYAYQKKKTTSAIKLNEVRNEYEKLILKAQLEIQDETIQEISREIHDNIGLSLTLAKLNMNTINLNHKTEAKERINKSTELLGKAISDLRGLSHSMNSEIIKSGGIIKALRSETERLNRTCNIRIDFSTTGIPIFLDTQSDLIIYRIFQESINNILKHSNATHVKIIAAFSKDQLELNIIDNGNGFKPEDFEKNNGSGLKIMKSRMEQINGTFHIESNETGTMIKLLTNNKQKKHD